MSLSITSIIHEIHDAFDLHLSPTCFCHYTDSVTNVECSSQVSDLAVCHARCITARLAMQAVSSPTSNLTTVHDLSFIETLRHLAALIHCPIHDTTITNTKRVISFLTAAAERPDLFRLSPVLRNLLNVLIATLWDLTENNNQSQTMQLPQLLADLERRLERFRTNLHIIEQTDLPAGHFIDSAITPIIGEMIERNFDYVRTTSSETANDDSPESHSHYGSLPLSPASSQSTLSSPGDSPPPSPPPIPPRNPLRLLIPSTNSPSHSPSDSSSGTFSTLSSSSSSSYPPDSTSSPSPRPSPRPSPSLYPRSSSSTSTSTTPPPPTPTSSNSNGNSPSISNSPTPIEHECCCICLESIYSAALATCRTCSQSIHLHCISELARRKCRWENEPFACPLCREDWWVRDLVTDAGGRLEWLGEGEIWNRRESVEARETESEDERENEEDRRRVALFEFEEGVSAQRAWEEYYGFGDGYDGDERFVGNDEVGLYRASI